MSEYRKVNLEIDKAKIIHEVSDKQLAIVEVYCCHDNMNSHQLPIELEAIKLAESTLYNKWLVAGYDKKDFMGHEGLKQLIVGFFPHENNIRYETIDGKTYLVARAILSKIYAPWAYEIFEKENYREVSMEISVVETQYKDDGYEWITGFIFNAITLLGKSHRAACPGSNAQIVKFEDFVEQGEKLYKQFADSNSITIDNSKESAVSGTWSNPATRLYKPILKSSNKESLISEAYLIHEQGYEENSSTKLKYPHHIIKNNKLVVHIRGVESAFSRAKQQGLTGEPIKHIRKHYKELGLDMTNFTQFGLTQEDVNYLFADDIDNQNIKNKNFENQNKIESKNNKKEDVTMVFQKNEKLFAKLVECCGGQKFAKDEQEMCKYSVINYDDTMIYALDNETKKMSAIPYAYSEDKVEVDFINSKFAKLTYEASDEEVDMSIMMSELKTLCHAMGEKFATDANLEPAADVARSKKETDVDKQAVNNDKDNNVDEAKMAKKEGKSEDDESKEDPKEEAKETKKQEEDEKGKKAEMSAKLEELEAKFTEISTKFETLEDEAKELREFKANILEQEKKAKVEFSLSEVSETMPKEKIEEWREKVVEFSSVDAWSNALKAEAFTYVKDNKEIKNLGFTRMGLPYPIEDKNKTKNSTSLWD